MYLSLPGWRAYPALLLGDGCLLLQLVYEDVVVIDSDFEDAAQYFLVLPAGVSTRVGQLSFQHESIF